MAKNVEKVNIFGQEYPIGSDEEPEYIRKVAAYVDEKMREASQKSHRLGVGPVAVLAAINITDELFKMQKKLDDAELRSLEYADEALRAVSELEKIRKSG